LAMCVVAALSMAIGLSAVGQIARMSTLVTFGALTAYIMLHLSVMYRLGLRGGSSARVFAHYISPVLGTGLLGYALWKTSTDAKVLGLSWMALGTLVACVLRRRGRTLETADGF
jgi:hypothetical protein